MSISPTQDVHQIILDWMLLYCVRPSAVWKTSSVCFTWLTNKPTIYRISNIIFTPIVCSREVKHHVFILCVFVIQKFILVSQCSFNVILILKIPLSCHQRLCKLKLKGKLAFLKAFQNNFRLSSSILQSSCVSYIKTTQ